MNPYIAQALANLQNANIAGYFEEIDKVTIPSYLQPIYNARKLDHIAGKTSSNFEQQLTTLANEINKAIQEIATLPAPNVYVSPKKNFGTWFQSFWARDETYYACLQNTLLNHTHETIAYRLKTYLPPLTKEGKKVEQIIETHFFKHQPLTTPKKIAFITGEAGTGKTTLMQKLFKEKAKAGINKRMAFIYCDHYTTERVEQAQQQGVQYIWIDAFDEDHTARTAQDQTAYEERLAYLLQKVWDFEKVIISMRTEFLPKDEILTRVFTLESSYHIALGLFDKPQVFDFIALGKLPLPLGEAMKTQLRHNDIFLRPFLFGRSNEILSQGDNTYIQTPYKYTYEAYERVIDNWARREQEKKRQEGATDIIDFPEKVKNFCERVALYLYQKNNAQNSISYEEIKQEQATLGLDLRDASTHALLVRDAVGNYHFSHSILLDYCIVQNLLKGNLPIEDFNKEQYTTTYALYNEIFMPQAIETFREGLEKHRKYEYARQTLEKNHLFLQNFSLNNLLPYVLQETYYQKMFSDDYFIQIILNNCGIQNLSFSVLIDILSNNKVLGVLFIENNAVQDITAVNKLTNLFGLSFKSNQITDIMPLQNLIRLEYLYFSNNKITNISSLQYFTNLQVLELDNNQIQDITVLQYLENLRYLGFEKNNIQDITPLLGLQKLQFLSLYGNPIDEQDILRLRKSLPDTFILFTHSEVKKRYIEQFERFSEESRIYFAKLWDITDHS